ncbi:fatty acyl-CoA hydrolase precursor, medium chain-like [Passer montanus]|uniref:fatty acyl-CoA hydrolase precursor, medium chain-like n=1 Tax=Passer montanus TaxID=9160 RepID=UPI001961A825|nr:fatty acyl-CoA hydrolase precursor, medium chain-like [Passer montanus]
MAAARDTALLAWILFLGGTALLAAEQPEAETKYGRVRGYQFRVDTAERTVNVFLALPFAKPPLGSLRFSEPQPPEPWQGVRDATSYPPMCLQDHVQGQHFSDIITNRKEKVPLQVSEDCLYLNVYTPVSAGKQEKLPVLVWIHGGALVVGAGSSYDGSALAALDNVVVVAIQYRLGIAGYFSTGDEHARGNWGYLDQVAALRWIQENILHFGGDPGSVTIFGGSAGGISVSALVLSPLAKGLFHKAISESGTAALGFFTDQPKEDAQVGIGGNFNSFFLTVLHILNCSIQNTETWFPSWETKQTIIKDSNSVCKQYMCNHVLLFKHPNIHKECRMKWKGIWREEKSCGLTSEVVDRVYKEYMGDAESPAQVRDGLLDAMGDVYFVISAVEVARHHRDAGNPVYFYEFQHRPSSAEGLVPEFVKADHGAEIAFVFGKPFLAGGATKEENELSRTVMRYWTNFAKNGNPNGEGLVHWPQYGLEEKYLGIDLEQKAAEKLKEHRVEFWAQLTKQSQTGRRKHTDL